MDYTLNRITLFALVFVTGIVVDDSIIIAENMHRHFKMKRLPFRQAALYAINEVANYSHHPKRRCDLVFGIDYADNADTAMQILSGLATEDPRVLNEPETWIRVTNLGDSSVDITVRMWCAADDYWNLRFDFTKAAKEAFDAGGITIPYPHQVEIQRQA